MGCHINSLRSIADIYLSSVRLVRVFLLFCFVIIFNVVPSEAAVNFPTADFCVNPVPPDSQGSQVRSFKLHSPSGKLELSVWDEDGSIQLSLSSGSSILTKIYTGRFKSDDDHINENYQIVKREENSIRENWRPAYGERKEIPNHYHEAIITLSNPENPISSLKLWCRMYDEGMAFRLEFDSSSTSAKELLGDLTSFQFPDNHMAWVSSRAQSEILKTTIDSVSFAAERPLVIRRHEHSISLWGKPLWSILPG